MYIASYLGNNFSAWETVGDDMGLMGCVVPTWPVSNTTRALFTTTVAYAI